MAGAIPHIEVWNLASEVCQPCRNGEYEKCTCGKESIVGNIYQSLGDLSNDSLDQCEIKQESKTFISRCYRPGFNNQYISDDEFDDIKERMLPPSGTDWKIIDSLLKKDIDGEEINEKKELLSARYSSQLTSNMQMVFVDSDESENESSSHYNQIASNHSCKYPGIELERNISSCDSGYVAGDGLDYNIEVATDQTRRHSLEPSEASMHLLASLKMYENYEKSDNDLMFEMHQKNITELKKMKEEFETHISQISSELVDELLLRDELYLHHESLLMDVDDLAKSCKEEDILLSQKSVLSNDENMSKKPQQNQPIFSPTSKIKLFWKR